MKKYYLLFTFWLISYCNHSQTDVLIGSSIFLDGESNLAVSPLNDQLISVAWIRVEQYNPSLKLGIASSYSSNGGQTWSTPAFLPHNGTNNFSADPVLLYRPNGQLYAFYIDYRSTLDSGAVYMCRSLNNGQTWSSPLKVIDNAFSNDFPVDRPWVAIDNTGGIYDGNIYVFTKSQKDVPYPHKIWYTKSVDDGITWSAPVNFDAPVPSDLILNSVAYPAVAANGNLVVCYPSYNPSSYLFVRFVKAISTDGGSTFNYSTLVDIPANNAFAASDTLYQYSYRLVAHPNDANKLFLAYTDNRNGDPDIYYNFSNDGGLSWSVAQRLNDDVISNGKGQDMLWLDYAGNGTLAAAWRDRRNGANGQYGSFRIYGAYSFDNGISWSSNLALSATPSPITTAISGNDFIGLAIGDSCLYTTWADFRNSTFNQLYANKYCTNSLVGIPKNEIDEDVDIFPNPFNEELFLKLKESSSGTCAIYDVSGRLIFKEPIYVQKTLSTKEFFKGIYIIEIHLKNKVLRKKIVKN